MKNLESELRAIYPSSLIDRVAARGPNRRTDVIRALRAYRADNGIKRLARSRDLVTVILEVAERHRNVRDARGRAYVAWAVPMAERFHALRKQMIRKEIEDTVVSCYRVAGGDLASNVVDVAFEDEVGATLDRKACWPENDWRPRSYRRYPAWYDWVWRVTLRPTWRMDVLRRVGAAHVEGHLVLDVVGDLRAPSNGEQALQVLVVVQGRGASVRVESRSIYRRSSAHKWRFAKTLPRTRWDVMTDTAHRVRRPAGYAE